MKRKTKGSLASTNKIKHAGIHLIAEFWGGKIIDSPKEIRKILYTATKKSNNTALGIKLHKFQPQGVTGFILLAESHISIHTWPEMNYIAIDIFSCGAKGKPKKALDYFRQVFKPKKVKIRQFRRG
ncbi:MAG: adenosylmethionine decarboxylase [Candidatus Nealsonbacteria bacterium]